MHLVECDVENPYYPQDLEIQNLHRQVDTLSRRLDKIDHRDQLFDEPAYEVEGGFLVYGDRPDDDDGDFEDPIYDYESDEDDADVFNTSIWDVYEDDNDILDQIFDIL